MTEKMIDKNSNITPLRSKSTELELARINRVTSLSFESLPESLIKEKAGLALAQGDGEELINRALSLWDQEN